MQNLDCQLQCVGGGNSTYTFGKPTAWTWEDSTIGSLLRSQFDGIRYKYTSIKRPTKRTPRLFLTLRTSSPGTRGAGSGFPLDVYQGATPNLEVTNIISIPIKHSVNGRIARMEPPRRENRGSQIEHTDVDGRELGISKRKIKAKVKTRSAMAWSLNESTWKSNISDVEKTSWDIPQFGPSTLGVRVPTENRKFIPSSYAITGTSMA
ncbi:hypothetical protein EDD15DRAFT_2199254 [Pisolithus albus]|nr:hypothetical protein EDD15DRAFT_2199254 [Pisolithus albus]